MLQNFLSFTQTAVCLTTGPYAVPKPALQTELSRVSYSNLQYPVFALKSPSSCLRHFALHPFSSILPSTIPSTTRCSRQFLRKMWPIQLTFLPFIFVGYSSPSCLYVTILHFSRVRLLYSSPSTHFKTLQVSLIYFSKCPKFSNLRSYTQKFISFFFKFTYNLLVKKSFFYLNIS